MFLVTFPSLEVTLDKEFKTAMEAHAYASSRQLLEDNPDLAEYVGEKYTVIEEVN